MLRKHWKKGAIALVGIALIFMLVSMMSCGGGESTAPSLSPFQVLNNTVQSVKTKVTKATSDIITANTGITQLRADLDAVVAGLPLAVDYSGNITALQAQINVLEGAQKATQMAIDTVAGKVETMKVNVATMQLLINAMNDNINTLSLRINNIEVALNLSP